MQGLDAADDYPEGPRWWLALAACVLVIVGAKLTLIWVYGSSVPYWDQWDAEAALLYRPYLDGHVPLSTFIGAHNEHRILTSRLLALGELEFAGRWDPILQMCVNALLHTIAVVTLMALLRRLVSAGAAIALTVFAAILLAIPFGWENALAGFQSQFNFVLLFSTIALALFARTAAFSPLWGGGIALSLLGYFSLSAGGCTPVVASVIVAMQLLAGQRAGLREWAGAAVLLVFGGVLLALVPTIPDHAPLKAQSLAQYLSALQLIASWPMPSAPFAPLLLNAPLLWLFIRVMQEKRPLRDPAWLCIAIGGWVAMQAVTLAYGRAVGIEASRYLDLISVGVLMNFVALAALLKDRAATVGLPRQSGLGLAGVWLVAVALGIGHMAMKATPVNVVTRGEQGKVQAENVRQYLATGDMAHLKDKPFLQVPYPNAERLASILNMPEIRGILPPELVDDPAARAAMQARLSSGGMFAPLAWKIRTFLPKAGPYIGFAGIALYFLAGLAGCLLATRSERAQGAASEAAAPAPAAPNLA
ncbi:hypothetical protein V5G24_02470 [Xanthobacter sp. VTT E-85241]|jgi:hypothetical protein|uniref:hypothetical protein n=1 Tax=Roseixanthobacter finlandensis TaxID=3119922 RepID=UPI000BD2EADF|nr:MAG: hypothetical protein B7Y61_12695 [Rhizobiales bacterium 35-66-30]OZA96199.1 MAG: hypothetical protein B7X67_24485 [Rhizobiales bacterium 39-66-18]HQS50111.1 hypothetical protein [Xanthobacteraceae bacterium]